VSVQMPIGSFLPGPFDNLMAAGETPHASMPVMVAQAVARLLILLRLRKLALHAC